MGRLFVGFGLAMVCIFKPKASPFLAPLYAMVEGVFLGVISKAFEIAVGRHRLPGDPRHHRRVLRHARALRVRRGEGDASKFQMVVIGATFGIFLLVPFGAFLLSLFGVDIVFWNSPSPLGIASAS